MRTPALQHLYLQKPAITLAIICMISVVAWIGIGEFYTKGEPREASVAQSMINNNEWILPKVYAGEIAYKPPMTHWLMAAFSIPQGKVTPFTSRLPSAIAFTGLIVFSFLFFGQKLKMQHAFLTCLILLTSFELHRAGMTSRVDMMLTFLTVLSLQLLFRWEDKKTLKGFPIEIAAILGLAALVKGPVGIVIPLLVFGIYLLVLKYNLLKIALKLLPVALVSLVLPAIWYILAYKTGGDDFFNLVWNENIGRFTGIENAELHYNLGHEEPFWYNFVTLIAGFIPWTIFLVISLFGWKRIYHQRKNNVAKNSGNEQVGFYKHLDFLRKDEAGKIKLFSFIAAVVIVFFYCIPLSKRSVYLMPAYPFIAVFIAQYVLYITEYHQLTSRIFGWIIGSVALLVAMLGIGMAAHWIDPVALAGLFTKHQKTLNDVAAIGENLHVDFLYFALFAVLIVTLYFLGKHLWKKNHLKILYATIAVYVGIFLVADGIFLPTFKTGVSIKPFAEQLQKDYPINENNLFVMNNLLKYSNMYGLNFYLNNYFRDFETEQANEGFFLTGKDSFESVIQAYGTRYQFNLLEEYTNKNRDGEKIIQFYSFVKSR